MFHTLQLGDLQFVRYLRKSHEEKRRQAISIAAQDSEVDSIVDRLRLNVPGWYKEECSAKVPGRPVFNQVVELIDCGEYDAIICWKLNRLARNPIDAAALLHRLDEGKIKAIVSSEGVFTGGGSDKMMMYMLFGEADQYSSNLSADVRSKTRKLNELGYWTSRPPLGYARDPEYYRDRSRKDLVRHPEKFTQVQAMWRLLLEGAAPMEILDIATRHWGLETDRHGTRCGGPLSKSQIYQLFRNQFYAGLMKCSGSTFEGRHEPMITMLEFERAQKLLDERVRTKRAEPNATRFPYRGLLRCGECGAGVTAKITKGKSGRKYRHYYCHRKDRRKGYCPQGVVREVDIDRAMASHFGSLDSSGAWLTTVCSLAERFVESQRAEVRAAKGNLVERIASLDTKLERLRDLLAERVLTREEYLADRGRTLVQKKKVEEQLNGRSKTTNLEPLEELKKALTIAPEIFRSGCPEAKRALSKALTLNLILKDKKVHILAKKSFEILAKHAPCSTRSGWSEQLRTQIEELLEALEEQPIWIPEAALKDDTIRKP